MHWAARAVGAYLAVLLAVGILATTWGGGTGRRSPVDSGGISHAQLEVDRLMTGWMAVQTRMAENGMLERSADPGYLQALEDHTYALQRMIWRVP